LWRGTIKQAKKNCFNYRRKKKQEIINKEVTDNEKERCANEKKNWINNEWLYKLVKNGNVQ
jgi:hypothetical protein